MEAPCSDVSFAWTCWLVPASNGVYLRPRGPLLIREESPPESLDEDALNMSLLHLPASSQGGTRACYWLECFVDIFLFCAEDVVVAAWFLLLPTMVHVFFQGHVCVLAVIDLFPPPNTCHFRRTLRDPPRLLRAADLSDHRGFTRLATNTTKVTESRLRRCEGKALSATPPYINPA